MPDFAAVFAAAEAAGAAAAAAAKVVPMVVVQHADPLNDASAVQKAWFEEGGVCGFAWVNVAPANSAFAKWLVANGKARKAAVGGVNIRVTAYGQSYQRKVAHAVAMAAALKAAGFKAYADDRLD